MQKTQLEEGLSQASWHCCPLLVQHRALGSAGLQKTCTPVPCGLGISLGCQRKTESKRVSKPGAPCCTNKHTVFTTFTHYSACLGHISTPFVAGVVTSQSCMFITYRSHIQGQTPVLHHLQSPLDDCLPF